MKNLNENYFQVQTSKGKDNEFNCKITSNQALLKGLNRNEKQKIEALVAIKLQTLRLGVCLTTLEPAITKATNSSPDWMISKTEQGKDRIKIGFRTLIVDIKSKKIDLGIFDSDKSNPILHSQHQYTIVDGKQKLEKIVVQFSDTGERVESNMTYKNDYPEQIKGEITLNKLTKPFEVTLLNCRSGI